VCLSILGHPRLASFLSATFAAELRQTPVAARAFRLQTRQLAAHTCDSIATTDICLRVHV
jgi:hypothetical protein